MQKAIKPNTADFKIITIGIRGDALEGELDLQPPRPGQKSSKVWFLRRRTNPQNPLQTHIPIHNAHIARSNQLPKNKYKSRPTFPPI